MAFDFKKNYIDWLYDNIDQTKISDNLYQITFPYLDRNNDHVEIYVQVLGNDTFSLTDAGETINELEFSGINIFKSERRQKVLQTILNAHGIMIDNNNALHVTCDKQSLPLKKHMLTQCILKVSDMFYLSKQNTQSLFIEDVKKFFDANEIYSIPDVSFNGKSGLVTTYDFGIPPSKNAPERMVKVVNNLDITKAGYITFLWGDIRDSRPIESKLYVFIQDTGRKVPQLALNTMSQYEIRPVLWSDKASVISELTV